MTQPIRVLLVDDHAVVRAGLRSMLERQPGMLVVGEAADGKSAVEMANDLRPTIILMDISMPSLNGLEATGRIVSHLHGTAVIVVSMYADESYLLRALKSGAKGYLVKDAPEEEYVRAIQAVSEGKAFFSPSMSKLLAEEYVRQLQNNGMVDSFDLLTTREREVLQLLAEGRTNKEAATLLFISPYTVETHRKTIFQKLNLHSASELLLYAVRKGLVR